MPNIIDTFRSIAPITPALASLLTLACFAPASADEPKGAAAVKPAQSAAEKATADQADAATWTNLDIREGGDWVESKFGGDGEVKVKEGLITLGFGDPLTGIRWKGKFPKNNYEITDEARRTNGFDFFCGLTLPAADQRFSLILGGWGGSLIGISSIGGEDAAHNETMIIRQFEQNRWYKVRTRVTDKKLEAWLDDDNIVDFTRDDRPLDIRAELEQSVPVGFASFQTIAELRNIRVRELTPAEIAASGKATAADDKKSPAKPSDKP
jgi:hypothetical protein